MQNATKTQDMLRNKKRIAIFAQIKFKFCMDYLRRIADEELSLRLEAFGAVQINGPKWCGKTTTAERQAKSVVKLQDPDKRAGYLATIRTKPSILLKGETPRLIDEWQDAPILWDAVRTTVDQRKLKGQFILTGSTVIKKKNEKDKKVSFAMCMSIMLSLILIMI